VIEEQHIGEGHGLFGGIKQFGTRFLFEGKGTNRALCTNIFPDHSHIRYSLLLATSMGGGVLAADIVEGSFSASKFAHFIDGLLSQMNPFPLPKSVVVMDNCKIHKNPAILDMITSRRA
jgi:hypothetical protein